MGHPRDTVSGNPPEDGHWDGPAPASVNPDTGQHRDYWVLPAAERAKGFVRPVRDSYRHLPCGTTTRMGVKIAETYARDPGYYSRTFCAHCRDHFPVGEAGEFVWLDDGTKVGT